MTEYRRLFIVGAQRSGTTYLYRALDAHPEIVMAKPMRPEPKFFLDEALAARGVEYYDRTCFPGAMTEPVRGEKSTSYIESPAAAERIARTFPGALVIVALRNPIDRAISNYWFTVNNGLETRPLAEALRPDSARRAVYDSDRFSVSPFSYLQRGHYVEYLTVYERHFSRDQIIILLFEVFTTDIAVIQSLYRRVGVSAAFVPDALDQPVNASTPDAEQAVTPALRASLRDYFAPYNARLAAHFNLNLHLWES